MRQIEVTGRINPVLAMIRQIGDAPGGRQSHQPAPENLLVCTSTRAISTSVIYACLNSLEHGSKLGFAAMLHEIISTVSLCGPDVRAS